jgi:sugar lactone lactonase YvrE
VGTSAESKQKKLLQRLKELGLPSAATIGAFSSLAKAEQPKASQPASPLVQIGLSKPVTPSYGYKPTLILGESVAIFSRSLIGIAVGAGDRIYTLGDGQIFIFESGGDLVRKWRAPEGASCLTIGPDGKVWIGAPGRVEIYSKEGERLGGFAAGETNRPAAVTSIKILRDQVLIADAAARLIRRYSLDGKLIGELGTKGQPGFMLPNRSLDMAVDARGVIWATDPGRHRISSWNMDGARVGFFGKFGQQNAEDFVGCCNPVNIAITPDGKIVAGEKVAARVKVYSPEGRLLALIGPEHFDPGCLHFHLAVDSKGRIIVADPVRLKVKVFSPDANSGVRKSL